MAGVSTLCAQTFYEPFAYEPSLLAGAGDWTGEEAPGAVQVVAGSLKIDGLAPSQKNRIKLPPTLSKVHEARRPLGASYQAPWFSFIIRVDSTENLDAATPFGILRLLKADGPAGPGIYLRKGATAEEVQIAASKRSNPQKISTAPKAVASGAPHLVVGRYNNSVTPHTLEIWIDPAPESLGAEEAPAPAFVAAEGVDLPVALDTLVVGGGVKCPGVLIDEIRVGDTWADVTPTH